MSNIVSKFLFIKNDCLLTLLTALQAALVIRGFAIRGFGYSRIHFCVLKFVIRGFSLDYPRIFK
jgi:hypothetical protein